MQKLSYYLIIWQFLKFLFETVKNECLDFLEN